MDLEQQGQLVNIIRDKLTDLSGERLRIRANMGRSRIMECEGVITQAHPQLFIMELELRRGNVRRQSYQYVDILTGTVELSIVESQELLFPTFSQIPN
ncbi:MAG: Veg family protein [Coriobacteriales bacterium]|jgi:uncharacterized protein Veg|nr:Veg family protein [Coriobacteriales bacterium]